MGDQSIIRPVPTQQHR